MGRVNILNRAGSVKMILFFLKLLVSVYHQETCAEYAGVFFLHLPGNPAAKPGPSVEMRCSSAKPPGAI